MSCPGGLGTGLSPFPLGSQHCRQLGKEAWPSLPPPSRVLATRGLLRVALGVESAAGVKSEASLGLQLGSLCRWGNLSAAAHCGEGAA